LFRNEEDEVADCEAIIPSTSSRRRGIELNSLVDDLSTTLGPINPSKEDLDVAEKNTEEWQRTNWTVHIFYILITVI
jgi:hypothetical protein